MNKKYMQWPVLWEHVTALEEEFWHADNGQAELAKSNEDYLLTLIAIRWGFTGVCYSDMGDVSFKTLIPYYMYLVDMFDHYDPIPEYAECLKRIDKLIDIIPSGAFIDSQETLSYFTPKMRELYDDKIERSDRKAVETDQGHATDSEEPHD
jgi:hypothetical protein